MKKVAIWFISCFTCAFAANHDLLLEFNEPVEITQVLAEYNVVSHAPMQFRPMIEKPMRMKNGETRTMMVAKPTHTYNVVIESEMETEELLESLKDIVEFNTGDPNHPGYLNELDAALNIDSRVSSIVDDIDTRHSSIMDTFTGSQPGMYGQYYTASVKAEDSWNLSVTGNNVIVAVLDTGIDLSHPFFAGSLVQGVDYVDNDWDPSEERNNLDSNGNGLLDEGWGHGSHVAGVIKSVAPNVKIMPIRVCDSDGQTDSYAIANGIAYAVNNGAHVINMSMSIYDSTQLMQDWLDYAQLYHIPVITSAGNDNITTMSFPATDSKVTTVASVDRYGYKSSFSNYSTKVELSAPGEDIWGPAPGGQYCARSGTSMAAPIVAAEVAMILELVPNATLTYINDRLTKAYDIYPYNPGYLNKLGYGLADIFDAITVQDFN